MGEDAISTHARQGRVAEPERSADEGLDSGIVQEVRTIVAALPTPRDREIVQRFYLDEGEKDDICR